MQIDLSKLEVVHNPAENRFETWIDGNLSKLDYIQDGKNFVITHVGVHPSLRGQGVAGRIVEVCLAYARENSLRVIPMCSYAAAFIRRHPEYAELTRQERAGE
jgi:predicted GNAT family acetyltransferase